MLKRRRQCSLTLLNGCIIIIVTKITRTEVFHLKDIIWKMRYERLEALAAH